MEANEAAGFHSEATGFGFHFLALARRDDLSSTSPPVFAAVVDVAKEVSRPQKGGGLDAAGAEWPRPLRGDSGYCRHLWAVVSTCVTHVREFKVAMGLRESDAHRVTHRRTTARLLMTESAGYAGFITMSTSIGAAFNSETCWDFSGYRGRGARSFGRCPQGYPYSIKRQRIELR